MNYQKLIVAGNVTQDAERKTSGNGDVSFTIFSVAVGDSKQRTTFFPITLFGQLGETLTQHITKGRQILVEGRVSIKTKAISASLLTRSNSEPVRNQPTKANAIKASNPLLCLLSFLSRLIGRSSQCLVERPPGAFGRPASVSQSTSCRP